MTISEQLKEPFPASDIEWRVMRSGQKGDKVWAKVIAYVQARAIQERLDEVFGVFGWQSEYKLVEMFESGKDKQALRGFLCTISVWDEQLKQWVKKTDGSETTDFEPFKGGLSGALKRTASAGLGIGRYLYDLEEGWADIHENGQYYGKLKDGTPFHWNPPSLPSNAFPHKAHGNNEQPKGLNTGMVKNIETLAENLWSKDWEKKLDKVLQLKYKKQVSIKTYPDKLEDEQGLMICKGLKEAIAKKDGIKPADVQNQLANSQQIDEMKKQEISDLLIDTIKQKLSINNEGASIYTNKLALGEFNKPYKNLNKAEIKSLLVTVMKKPKKEDNCGLNRSELIRYICVDLLGQIGGQRFESFKSKKIGNRQFKELSDRDLLKFRDDLEHEVKIQRSA